MFKKLFFLILNILIFLGGATSAHAVLNYNVKTGEDSRLFIHGSTGNTGIGTTEPVALFQVGVNPSVPSGSIPAGLIKGNLVVDGKIYGDGANLTNLPSTISGLTPTSIPKASSATSLVDSSIYEIGNYVGVGSTNPRGPLDIQAGTSAPSKMVNLNGTFLDLAGSRVGLNVDVTSSVVGAGGPVGVWGEVRTTANAGTYTNAVVGVYAEALHSGSAQADYLVGAMTLANQYGAGNVSNAYGLYPQVWKGSGTITNAYGMYFDGVPNANGDTGVTTGTLVNQYGIAMNKLTIGTTRNMGIFLDDSTPGPVATGNFGIYEEVNYDNYFAGNIGVGTFSPNAQLKLFARDTNVIDVHETTDTTGTYASETHYKAGDASGMRTTPSDVQRFRFFGGFGGFQEVVRMSVTTLSVPAGIGQGAINFSTQGADGLMPRLSIDTNVYTTSNMGIGSSAPRARLEVVGTGSTTGTAFQIDDNLYNPKVTVLDNGNVGIGTARPLTYLHVAGFAMEDSASIFSLMEDGNNIFNVTARDGANLRLGVSRFLSINTDGSSTIVIGNSGGIPAVGAADHLGLLLVSREDQAGAPYGMAILNDVVMPSGVPLLKIGVGSTDATTEYMRVDSSGNIGIGTTLTAALLHVGSGMPNAFDVSKTTNAYIAGDLEVDGKIYGDGSQLTNVPGTISGLTGAAGYGKIPRATSATTLADSNIYQNANGCIGIGTTVPTSELYVYGNAYIRGNLNLSSVSGNISTPGTITAGRYEASLTAATASNGIVSNSSSTLSLFTGGRERIRLDSNGNVGIASSSPRAKLEIVGTGSTTGRAFQVDDNLYNPKVTVLDNGNVGIGTSSPVASLHVGAGMPNAFDPTKTTNAYIAGDLEVDGKIYGDGSGLTNVAGAVSGLTNYSVPRSLADGKTLIDSGIYLDANENVGVGIASPVSKLHVNGSGIITTLATYSVSVDALSWASDLILRAGRTSGGIAFQIGTTEVGRISNLGNLGVGTVSPRAKLEIVGSGSTTGTAFQIDDNLYNPKVTVLDNGNVGIGSSVPQANLEVDGTLYINGNIGIGTTNPLAKLHVSSGGILLDRTQSLQWRSGGSVLNIMNLSSGDNVVINNPSNNSLLFQRNGNTNMMIGTGGNVGIGTTAPRGKLEVDGSLYVPNGFGNIGFGTTSAATLLTIGPTPPMLTAGSSPVAAVKGDLVVDGKLYGDGSNLIGITGGSGISGLTTYAVPMASSATTIVDSGIYLDANGNVGIGTTSITTKFEVVDGSGYMKYHESNQDQLKIFGINPTLVLDGDGTSFQGVMLKKNGVLYSQFTGDGTNAEIFTPGDLFFYVGGNEEKVRITGAGNLGIGTSAPRAKLEIVASGSTTGTAFQIDDNLYNPKVIVLDNGNVGIGTSQPINRLHVAWISGDTATTAYFGSNSVSNNQIAVQGTSRTNYGVYGLSTSNTGVYGYSDSLRGVDGNSNTGVGTRGMSVSGIGGYFNSVSGYGLIVNSGNVGFGTTTPRAKLEVVGTGSTTGTAFQIDDNLYNPKVTVLDNGNVGIGTESPTQKIGIQGNSPLVSFLDATTSRTASVGLADTFNMTIVGPSGGDVLIRRGATIWMDIGALGQHTSFNVGNVGIGTTATVALLHVGAGTPNAFDTSKTTNAYIAGDLEVDGKIYGDGSGLTNVAGGIGGLTTYAVPRASSSTSLVDSGIYLDASGNVGIATLTPSSKLDVNGSIKTTNGADSMSFIAAARIVTTGYMDLQSDGSYLRLNAPSNYIYSQALAHVFGNENATSEWMRLINGNLGIATIAPRAKLEVVGTGSTTGTAFQIDDNLYNPKVTVLDNGNVGVGSVAPAQKLHVEGHCMTGDSILQVVRRGDPLGRPERIDALQPGDSVLTLDESTGQFVYRPVNGLLFMGTKPVFELTTQSGKKIRTTGNHPYLTRATQRVAPTDGDAISDNREKIAQSRINEIISRGVVGADPRVRPVPDFSEEHEFAQIQKLWTVTTPEVEKEKGQDQIDLAQLSLKDELHSTNIINLTSRNKDVNCQIAGMLSATLPSEQDSLKVPLAGFEPATTTLVEWSSIQLSYRGTISNKSNEHLIYNQMLSRQEVVVNKKNVQWVKVIYLESGDEITVTGGVGADPRVRPVLIFWDKIKSITYVGQEPVYDIEVEGTHNFVANGIVAHNTYISGNTGVGTTAPQASLEIGAATTIPSGSSPVAAVKGNLVVDGYLYGDGSKLTGVSGISGLTTYAVPTASSSTTIVDSGIYSNINGNVGINSLNPRARLDVVGSIYASGALTTNGGNLTVNNYGVFSNYYDPPSGGVTGKLRNYSYAASSANTVAYQVEAYAKTNTSGTYTHFQLIPAYNQVASTASNTDFLVNRTETSIGSGLQYLLRLQNTNTDKFNVTNMGNVGVGTFDPRAKIEIVASGSTTGTAFQIDDNLYNPKVTVLDNGNVGIGSVLPYANLDVNGTLRATNTISLNATGKNIHNIGLGTKEIYVGESTSTWGIGLSQVVGAGDNSNLLFSRNASILVQPAANYHTKFSMSGTGNFLVNTSQLVVQTSSGNVGVATLTPRARLEVVGSGTATAAAFQIDDNLYNPKVTVLDNGNVGIGSVNPSAALDVVGNVRVPNGTITIGATSSSSTTYSSSYINWLASPSLLFQLTGNYLYNNSNGYNWTTTHTWKFDSFNTGTKGLWSYTPTYTAFTTSTVSGSGALEGINIAPTFGSGSILTYSSSSSMVALALRPTININSASTGNYTALLLNATETSVGSGITNYLTRMQVNGADKFLVTSSGNVGIGSSLPQTNLEIGSATSIPSGSLPVAALKGDLVVDGKLYGDGSNLTGITGGSGISGLTTYAVPRASSSTTIVDSGIYLDANGNVGIGSTTPRGALVVENGQTLVSDGSVIIPSLGFNDDVGRGIYRGNSLGATGIGFTSAGALFLHINEYHMHSPSSANSFLLRINNPIASQPTYSFYGDSTTGMYRPGSNSQIAFSFGGVEKIRLSDGNVGIGTFDPRAKLEIVASGSTTGMAFQIDDNLYNPKVTVLDNGNVGVGTYVPTSTFVVNGTSSLNGSVNITSISGVDVAFSGASAHEIGTVGNSDFTLATNNTGRLVVKGTGNIGIGSTTPAALFDVGGTVVLRGSAGQDGLIVTSTSNVGIGTTVPRGLLEVDATPYVAPFIVTSALNVGVGTFAPEANLHVGAGSPTLGVDLSSNSALIKGNLEVDGYLYGNGSNLTNLPGGISGLTTYAVPMASSSTTIVDSGIYVDANGNVGIGSSIPGTALEIKTTQDNPLRLREIGGGWNYIEFYNSTARQGYFGIDSAGDGFQFSPSSGKVTIPDGNLSVGFSLGLKASSNELIVRGNTGIGTISPRAKLEIVASGSTTGTAFQIDDNLYNPKVTVLDNGNVGIGSTMPTAEFQVASSRTTGYSPFFQISAGKAAGQAASVGFTRLNSTQQALFAFETGNSGNPDGYFGTFPNKQDALYIFSNTGSGSWPAIGIDSTLGFRVGTATNIVSGSVGASITAEGQVYFSGNVGIATTAPQAKLEIVALGSTTGTAFQIDDSLYNPKVTVLDNGNLGVGSTLPQARLEIGIATTIPSGSSPVAAVKGNLVVDGYIYGDGSKLTGVSGISGLTTYAVPRASSSTTIVDSGIYLNASGNVGVGTVAPIGKFEVSGTGGKVFRVANTQSQDLFVVDEVNHYVTVRHPNQNDATTNELRLIQNDSTTAEISARGSLTLANRSTGYNIVVTNTIGFNTGVSSAMRILANGNVGINTSAPASLFEIGSGKVNVLSGGNVGVGTFDPRAKLEIVGSGSTSGTVFQIDDNLYNPKVTVLDNGKVGIGTMNPGAPLQINNAVAGGSWNTPIGLKLTTTGSNGYVITANNNFIVNYQGYINIGDSNNPTWPISVTGSGDTIGILNTGIGVNTGNNIIFRGNDSSYNSTTIASIGSLKTTNTLNSVSASLLFSTKDVGTLAERMRIDNSGNVGIGTTGPRAKLEIVASGLATGAAFQIDDNLYNPKVTVLDNGNVGIGSTLPQARLEIGIATTIPSGSSPVAAVKGDLVVDGKLYGDGSNLTGITGGSGISGLTTYAVPRASSSTTIVDSGIYLDANGNVGVGTILPISKLQVFGGIQNYAPSTGRSLSLSSGADITGSNHLNFTATASYISLQAPNNYIYYKAQSGHAFLDGTGTIDLVRITGVGNVGVGTTIPRAKLEVVGETTTTGVAFQIDDNLYNPKVTVLDNGYIGIGTTSPEVPLMMGKANGSAANSPMVVVHNTPLNAGTVGDLVVNHGTGMGYMGAVNAIRFGGGDSVAPFIAGVPGTAAGANYYALIGLRKPGSGWYSSAAALSEGQYLPGIGFAGQSGTARGQDMELSASILGVVDGSVSAGVLPAALVFHTSTTNMDGLKEQMRITSSGNIGMGTLAPRAKLEIAGSGSTTGTAFQIDDNLYNPKVTILDNGNVGVGTVLPRAKFEVNNTMIFSSEYDNGNSGATKTIDWNVANKQRVTLNDSCTFTFTAPGGPANLVLMVIHDATTTNHIPTWPAAVKWPGGTKPVHTATSGAVDAVSCYYNGTVYYCAGNLDFR